MVTVKREIATSASIIIHRFLSHDRVILTSNVVFLIPFVITVRTFPTFIYKHVRFGRKTNLRLFEFKRG